MAGVIPDEFKAKLRRLLDAREAKDQAKAEADRKKAEFEAIQAEVWEELAESDVEGALKVNLGEPYGKVTFQAKETYYSRVLDNDAAVDYFEEHHMLDEVSEPKLSKARLNELVRERLEANVPLPDGIDWTPTRYISVSRPK